MLLFDCEEYYMQNRLIKRGKESGRIDDNISAIAKKLHYYKHNTLPIMKYYDDNDKLVVVSTYLKPLSNQHTVSGHYQPTSETPLEWRFAGGSIVTHFYMLTG